MSKLRSAYEIATANDPDFKLPKDQMIGAYLLVPATSTSTRTCKGCKYAIFEEYGYSCYTTEGVTFNCARQKHPEDGFDRFFGEDERFNYAERCDGFSLGEPIEMDIDQEEVYHLTDEQKVIWEEWKSPVTMEAR